MPYLRSVLLVDDDPTNNYLNKLLLKRLNVAEQVLVAENGEEALRLLASSCVPPSAACPQLILLDLNMPVMNGLAFLEAYAQLPLAHQQHVIVALLTSSLHERDRQRAGHLPVAEFLTKPLTQQKVTDLLARHFSPVS